MPGALDYYNDPATQGMLGLAMGLLKAGGASPYPVGIGGAMGQGLEGMQQGYRGALQNQMSTEQIKQLQLANTMAGIRQKLVNEGMNEPQGQSQQPQQPQQAVPPVQSPVLSGQGLAGWQDQPQPLSQPQSQSQAAGGPLAQAGGYFNPQELYRTGKLYALAGLPEGAAMMNAALSHDPNIAANMPTDTAKLLREAGIDPQSPQGRAFIRQKLSPAIANRGFGLLVPNAQGGYSPNPESEAQIARTTAMKTAGETVPVTSASGATVPTFKFNLPGFWNLPGASAAGTPPQAQPTPTPAPVPAPAPAAASAPTPTAAKGDPWTTMPKLQAPTGLGQTTYQKGRMQEAATLAGQLTTKASDGAAIANERLVYNTQSLDLVNAATSGSMSLSIANVKNFLNSRVGVPLELMDKVVAGDANATTALNKDLINAATQKAKQAYGSRITQSEVMLQIKQASPNVDQMKATIRYLLRTDSAMSQYQIQKAANLGRYLNSGGDPYRFEGWHSQNFPMASVVSGIHIQPNETAGSSKVIDDLVKKYASRP